MFSLKEKDSAVSSFFYTGAKSNVSSVSAAPRGLFVCNDGVKYYVVSDGGNPKVSQFTMLNPWNIDSSTYDGQQFDLSSVESTTTYRGVYFKHDGTRFYFVDRTNDAIYQCDVLSAWNIDTATYGGVSFDVYSEDAPDGIFIASDGSNMYVAGISQDKIRQYLMPTPWELDTATYIGKSFSMASEDGVFRGLDFSIDGSKFYTIGGNNRIVLEYDVLSAWNIDTSTYKGANLSLSEVNSVLTSVVFNSIETRMYVMEFGGPGGDIYQYELSDYIEFTPEYDFKNNSIKIEDDSRTSVGRRYVHKYSDVEKRSFGIRYVNSSDRCKINSWWGDNTDLTLYDNYDGSLLDCRIINENKPIGQFELPYKDSFFGSIELGEY